MRKQWKSASLLTMILPPVALQLIDSDKCNIVMNENSNDDSDDDQQNVNVDEKISIDRMISLTEETIHGMEQRSFTIKQQIMSVYKITQQLLRERPKHTKQLPLQEMF
jgi:hypothetical protein